MSTGITFEMVVSHIKRSLISDHSRFPCNKLSAWLILAMSTINESREGAALLGVELDYMFFVV